MTRCRGQHRCPGCPDCESDDEWNAKHGLAARKKPRVSTKVEAPPPPPDEPLEEPSPLPAEDLSSLSVRELKRRLGGMGVGHEGAIEKADLVERLSTALASFLLANPPSPPADLLRAKAEARQARKSVTGRASRTWGGGTGREQNASIHQVALAEEYRAEEDDARLARELWVATEKYDGIRAVWWPDGPDGPGFKGRNGKFINPPPPSFAALLPMDMRLDGELWAGRRRFEVVGSLMGSKSVEGGRFHEAAWRSLTFVVFDAPFAGGSYLERLAKARARLAHLAGDSRVKVTTALPCADAAEKARLLHQVTGVGGEGLVLRRVEAIWEPGSKKRDLLKVKQWWDAEAEVVSYENAPTTKNLPTIKCRALNLGVKNFDLAVARESEPLPKGTIVTFKYRQVCSFTRVPTYKSLVRVHDEDCDCDVCSSLSCSAQQSS